MSYGLRTTDYGLRTTDYGPRTTDHGPRTLLVIQTLGEIKAKVQDYVARFGALRSEIGRVIVGQEEIVEGTLLALMAGGHVLLEGVPGLGKTLLVRTLGETMGLDFARVQFTPDLMPADIVGTNIIVEDETGGKKFRFRIWPRLHQSPVSR